MRPGHWRKWGELGMFFHEAPGCVWGVAMVMMEGIKLASYVYISIVTGKCAMDIRAADLLVLKESIRSLFSSSSSPLLFAGDSRVGLFRASLQ